MALFEETDVLCVADREGGRVECVQAGLQKPLHANRDDTGRRVVNYNSRQIGRPYAIAAKGTALLVLRGSPGAKGLTIDTAAEPEEEPIIDEWATSDVSILTHFFTRKIEDFFLMNLMRILPGVLVMLDNLGLLGKLGVLTTALESTPFPSKR